MKPLSTTTIAVYIFVAILWIVWISGTFFLGGMK